MSRARVLLPTTDGHHRMRVRSDARLWLTDLADITCTAHVTVGPARLRCGRRLGGGLFKPAVLAEGMLAALCPGCVGDHARPIPRRGGAAWTPPADDPGGTCPCCGQTYPRRIGAEHDQRCWSCWSADPGRKGKPPCDCSA